jgi:alanine racemase
MVRVGLGLYGYGPEQMPDGAGLIEASQLRPAVRWVSHVAHLQEFPAGSSVGYGRTRMLRRDSRLAIVPVGYADGYPLSLSNKGVVSFPELNWDGRPWPAPVIGKVNMDQLIVDVTDVPGIALGAEAELISADPKAPNALPRLAESAESSCYEMLTRIASHVPRRHVHPQAPDPGPGGRSSEAPRRSA